MYMEEHRLERGAHLTRGSVGRGFCFWSLEKLTFLTRFEIVFLYCALLLAQNV